MLLYPSTLADFKAASCKDTPPFGWSKSTVKAVAGARGVAKFRNVFSVMDYSATFLFEKLFFLG